MTQGTLSGTKRKRIRKSGFRARMRTSNGRCILQSRRRKKRKKISI